MKITFTRAEKDFIEEVAEFRTIANKNSHDIDSYNPAFMKFNRQSQNLVPCAGEAAVVKACGYDLTNVKHDVWNHFYLPSHRDLYSEYADVTHNGQRFEVRNVNKPESPLVVRTKDLQLTDQINVKTFMNCEVNGKGDITSMDGYVTIIGWIDSHEGWNIGDIPNYNGYLQRDARQVFDQYLNTNFEEALQTT